MSIRIVLDASAAANIVMRTDSATRLIDKLEKAALVIDPEANIRTPAIICPLCRKPIYILMSGYHCPGRYCT